MLEAKIFEVRDRATLIPIMAVKVTSGNPHERALAGWVGYTGESKSNIIVTNLHNLNTYHDVQECDGSEIGRTMTVAMAYIQAGWESLQSGDLIDVEFVLKEVDAPKTTDMHV